MEKQQPSPSMAGEWDLASHIPPALETPEIPLLSVGLQAMGLSDQGQNQQNREEEKEEFTLLLKVACSGGTPKILSLGSVQQAMIRAWRNNFYKVSQVNQLIFRAHFSSFESMMFVYTKQPWTVGSDVMLIEFESPRKDIEKGDYKFEYVYATIRAYGIPKKHRSFKILKDILNLVGNQSEFHELRQVMLESRPDYIWGIAKIKVGMSVYDRVKLLYSVNEAGITYLNYEKIGRICVFCGVMFHTVRNCNLRQRIVAEKIRSGQADQAQQVPFQRYGSWMVEPADIPINFAVQGEGSNPIFSTYQSPHIGRSQRAIGEDQLRQRAGEGSNAGMTRRRLQFEEHSSAKEHEQQLQDSTVHTPRSIDGGNQTQSGARRTAIVHERHVGGTVGAAASAGKSVLENNPASPFPNPQLPSLAKSPPKRASTSLDLVSQQAAKRAAPATGQDGDGGDADLQAMQMCPPAFGAGSLGAQLEEGGGARALPSAAQAIADSRGGGGILGARPSFSNKPRSNPNPTLSAARSRNRRRPSGWDVEEVANAGIGHRVVGITHHKPGASTWRRVHRAQEVAVGNAGGRDAGQTVGIFGIPNSASNCASPAHSSSAHRADHDPWPLHTPSPSHSMATQDSQQGGFSPPPLAREHYVGMDGCFGSDATGGQANVQGQIQLGTSSNDATQAVCDNSGRTSMDMDLEAAAPALKAPRAP
nr:uncharacterized protein LOC127303845 [Lolium perenne]